MRLLLLVCLLSPWAAWGAANLEGKLIITGSDTLAELVTVWADAFIAEHPRVSVEIQATGSGSAPPALAEGTANIGSMSRTMSAEEIERFERLRGYLPTAVPVGIDVVVVIVNADNPLSMVSLAQIDGLFSQTFSCSNRGPFDQWSDLGVSGSLGDIRIERFGRTSASGTYGLFKQLALCGGDFSQRVNELPGSAAIVDTVGSLGEGIGYTGIGFVNDRVRVLDVVTPSGERVPPTTATALSGEYPFARLLYFYFARPPGEAFPKLECAFLQFVTSDRGARLLEARGFIALPAEPSAIASVNGATGCE